MFLQSHPVLEALPAAQRGSFEAGVADMAVNGQDWPIVLYEGMIWDGRARYQACAQLGVKPWLVPLRRKDPVEFYIRANYHRVGEPRSSERSQLITTLSKVDDRSRRAVAAAKRRAWIREARAEFENYLKTRPEPCTVCDKHIEFVHAHHSFPLSLQYECGRDEAIHDHKWLCPVHHKRVHMLLSGYLLGARDLAFLDRIPDACLEEWNAIERVACAGINLCCHALGQSSADKKPRRYDPPYGLFIALNHKEYYRWPKT